MKASDKTNAGHLGQADVQGREGTGGTRKVGG